MKSVNYPLALPLDFLGEFKQAAKEAGLSTAATIRQSAKLGLPKFREQISSIRRITFPISILAPTHPNLQKPSLNKWLSNPNLSSTRKSCASIKGSINEIVLCC